MTSPERADWQEMAWPVSNRSCYTDCTHTGMPGLPAQLSGTWYSTSPTLPVGT